MAIQIPNGRQRFTDANGVPLAGGSVAFYTPGTTTPKATYQDAASTIQNTNPIFLDSSGSAVIWGDGTYRQVVFDANGNQIWDEVTSASTAGTANAFAGGITVGGSGVVVSAGGAAITGDVTVDGAFSVNSNTAQVSDPTGANLTLQGNPGTFRGIFLKSISSTPERWLLGADSSPESGGNSGSNLFCNRYSDSGSFLDTALFINRVNGSISLPRDLLVGGGVVVGGFPALTTSSISSGVGWMRNAGGMIVQWGVNNAGGGAGLQNYPITFPGGTGFVGVTPFNPGCVLNVSSLNNSAFAWATTSPTGFYFLAIGN